MASELATAFVRVRPNLTGFKAEAEAGTKQAGAALGKVFALAFGTVAVEELARHVVTVAAQQDAMFAKIKQLTKSAGADWTVYGQTVQEQIIKKSESSGFAVDQLANAYGRLIQQTKNSKQALSLLTTASDVARARGTAVTQVATSLSRALGGNAQALSRLGIIVPKYTVQQDAAKKKLQELAEAETALAEIRKGDAPINLDAQAKAYETLGSTQRTELKATLTAQLAAAAASDKQIGAQKTLQEVSERFKGQGEIFGETAAGQADRFQISVHELEVTIGEHLIPLLGSAAIKGREWAEALGSSATVGHAAEAVAQNIASGVSEVAAAIAAAYPAIKLTAEAIGEVLGTVGAGPLLATYAAFKLAQTGAALYADGVKKLASYQALAVKAATQEAAANTAAAATTTAQTAATAAGAEAQVAKTVATASGTTATIANARVTLTSTAANEAQAVAITTTGTAAAAASIEVGLLDTALAAITSIGILPVIAAVAGGLYYLSTRESEASKLTADLSKQMTDLAAAHRDAASAAQTLAAANAQLPKLDSDRATAIDDIATAQSNYDQAAGSGHASRATLAADAKAIADAQARWRDTNKSVATTESAKAAAVKASADAETAVTIALANSAGDLEKLRDSTYQGAAQRLAGAGNPAAAATQDAENYANAIRKARDNAKDLTQSEKDRYTALAGYVEGIERAPTDKEINLYLNTDPAMQAWNALKKTISDVVENVSKPGARGDQAKTVVLHSATAITKQIADATVDGIDQGVSQASIRQQVAQAFKDAVVQAKQSLVSIGSTLAGQVGQLLDAQLAASEAKLASSPAALAVKQLTADAAALQARISGRDAQAQTDTAQATLASLQKTFGPGAHTAAQDAQIVAAQNAVLDAQDSAAAAADTAEASRQQDALDRTKTNLETRESIAKAAAAQRIADLTDELNKGVISEKQFASKLPGILAAEGVKVKNAGKLLGVSFADGFNESFTGAISQARINAALSPAERGKGTGAAPIVVDPRKVAQTTRQGLESSGDQKAVASNTADTVTEIKKLGAIVEKHGKSITFVIPPDVSKKDRDHIAKLAGSLK